MSEKNSKQREKVGRSRSDAAPARCDTYSYRGWLNSDYFCKRALAVWGYGVAVQLVLGLILAIIIIVTGIQIAPPEHVPSGSDVKVHGYTPSR